MFGVIMKDLIPGGLRSRLVCKFACAGCDACYVGETVRHLSTRVKENLASDSATQISKLLQFLNIVAFVFSRLFSCFGSRLN